MKVPNFKAVFKLQLAKLLAFIPTRLPVGMTEFETWSSSIITMYGWPDNDSMRFALAAMIINLGATQARVSKRYFGLSLHTACSKQVAGQVFHDLKIKQQKQMQAEKLEVTGSLGESGPSNAQQLQ